MILALCGMNFIFREYPPVGKLVRAPGSQNINTEVLHKSLIPIPTHLHLTYQGKWQRSRHTIRKRLTSLVYWEELFATK